MLKSLRLRNFTLFRDTTFQFGKNLNVVIGENGTGKTHILKAAYSGIATLGAVRKNGGAGGLPGKQELEFLLASKLKGVFRPDSLGRLVWRQQGRLNCELEYSFHTPSHDMRCSFSRLADATVKITRTPKAPIEKLPVYLPTREVLSIYPNFAGLYEERVVPFEETWLDICHRLAAPLARGPREERIRKLLAPLEETMGGRVEVRAERFYLKTATGDVEIHLVAEGLRKLAAIARLIATGALLDSGYLFWDEPEANLNPRIVKTVAKTILQLAQSGVQVFVATHSLFLVRELHILCQGEFAGNDVKCFGLHLESDGAVSVRQGGTMDDVGDIAILDEELEQAERYVDTEMRLGVRT